MAIVKSRDAVMRISVPRLRSSTPMRGVWGDGFADDGLCDFADVGSADALDRDELLFLHRGLTSVDGTVDPSISRHLRVLPDQDNAAHLAKSARCRALFADDLPSWMCIPAAGPACGETPKMDLSIDRAIVGGRASALGPSPRREMMAFSYLTGIHAGYLWAEAAPLNESVLTAGWLGVLATGRSALMPLAVADCLADVLPCEAGGAAHDPALAALIGDAHVMAQMASAVAGRRAGAMRPVRISRPLAASLVSAARRVGALVHLPRPSVAVTALWAEKAR